MDSNGSFGTTNQDRVGSTNWELRIKLLELIIYFLCSAKKFQIKDTSYSTKNLCFIGVAQKLNKCCTIVKQ